MMKNKKAIFFSLISLFLIIVLVMDFQVASKININKNKMSSTNTRIQILNNFVFDLEDRYFDSMIYISTKNAIKNISEDPSLNISNNLTVSIKNGGSNRSYNLESLTKKLNDVYNVIGINITNLEVKETELSQDMPYIIHVKQKVKYQIDDLNKVASWRGTIEKDYDMDIRGFKINNVLVNDMNNTEASCITGNIPGYSCGCSGATIESFLGALGLSGYDSDSIKICKTCKVYTPGLPPTCI